MRAPPLVRDPCIADEDSHKTDIISTASPHCSFPLYNFLFCICTAAVWYTVPWNVLNFPCGVVPVTKVTNGDLQVDKTSYPAKDIFHKTMKQVSYAAECFVITILVLGDFL